MPKNIVFLDDSEWPSDCFGIEFPTDPSTTGLVVIDMQNYCVDPRGDLAHSLLRTNRAAFEGLSQRLARVTANVERLVSAFRAQAKRVVFTRNAVLLPDRADLIPRRRKREQIAMSATKGQSGHLPLLGSSGHEIIPSLRPVAGELVLDKNTASAFNSTAIELLLRNLKLQTLIMAGLMSDFCVLLTALDAADRGFNVIIANDACTTIDPGSHEAAMLLFRRGYGYVLETQEIVGRLSGAH
ncbi:MAG: cysteine hydrolase [Acidobacteria bacterium]|nr:cysteine hydrolase [Acidobacteriota bacterium]